MKRSILSKVLPALLAGLVFGSAERVSAATVPIGIPQTESVLYALTLVDAEKDDETGEYLPVTETTANYKVCLTVSVPRVSATAPAITVNAVPATLMYRPHNGKNGTAWSGSIFMSAETPKYYPMPQTGTINRDSTNPTNVDIGTLRDPARWERRFYSNTITANNPLIASLIEGQASYEWYAASRYGLGFFSVVSDIQDHGRKMDFTDHRLWVETPPNSDAGANTDQSDDTWDALNFGDYNYYTLNSMVSADNPWTLNKVALGVAGDSALDKGALLLQDPTVNYPTLATVASDGELNQRIGSFPMILSPIYPDGVSEVSFKVKTGLELEGNPQFLLVQARVPGMGDLSDWSTKGLTVSVDGEKPFTQNVTNDAQLIVVKSQFSTVKVTMDEATAGIANTQFRIVRISSYSGVVADAVSLPICVRELRVRSATPVATFAEPYVTVPDQNATNVIAPACEDKPFAVNFDIATPNADRKPCGYDAVLKLARRVDSDKTRATYEVALKAMARNSNDSTLIASFDPIADKYTLSASGANNLAENAFYLNKGLVTGVMAGIYDMTLDCGVLGSFEAGRTIIDGRESTNYELSVLDDPEKVMRPFILDVREATTSATKVELIVNYRTKEWKEDETGTEVLTPVIKQTSIEMIPSGLADKTWTVDLPKELRVSRDGRYLMATSTENRDEDAEYVWCASPNTPTGPFDAQAQAISFQLRVTTPSATNATAAPEVRWFGQAELIVEDQTPTIVGVFPGTTFALSEGVESKNQTYYHPAPVVIDCAASNTSHVTLTFVEGTGVNAAGTLSINGSFAQDFNMWDAISNGYFSNSDYRENVRWTTADFDAEIVQNDDRYLINSGWVPDQGPLAETTEYYDVFEAGRRYGSRAMHSEGEYRFFVKTLANQAREAFASWGASHADANFNLLLWSNTSTELHRETEFFQFGATGTPELVINRDTNDMHQTNNGWLPDLMVRLSSSPSIMPRADLGLKGVGTISFNLSRSEPYDIDKICQVIETNTFGQLVYSGVSAKMSVTRHAKSGYSTSLYLINNVTAVMYELRVTQVLNLSENLDPEREKPKECLVMELWKWTGDSAKAMTLSNGATFLQVQSPTTLENAEIRLWVDASSCLRAQIGTNANTQIISKDTVGEKYPIVAVGSAECWPTFNNVSVAKAPSNNPGYTALTSNLYMLSGGAFWSRLNGEASALTLRRDMGTAADVAQLQVLGVRGSVTEVLDTINCSESMAGTPVTLTVGRSDLELQLVASEGSSLFIDNIRVSSWQGNDELRNGDYVPLYTDTSWDTTRTEDGFSAVGVWVLPVDEAQNTVEPENYTGDQCMLMQYSRRNVGESRGEDEDDLVKHTGSTLALYTPYSNEGFGAITFRYRIPSESEFKENTSNPEVSLLLQYRSATSSFTENLGAPKPNSAWENASEVLQLMPTDGEWHTATITPRLNGSPILPTHTGVLRLVMVAPTKSTDDPYIYIDDFRMTSNSGEKALWSSGNTLLGEDPINALYWKDRLEATSTEADFAWYSRLTRGMQFNNSTTADVENGVEEPLERAFIVSPISENGIGVVKFAARLTEPKANKTPIRLYVTEKSSDAIFPEDYKWVETFEVADTVYRQFSVDLAKHEKVPNARMVRAVYLHVPTKGDAFEEPTTETSRVWMDKLSIAEPVSPTLRLSNVAFSTIPGDDFGKHLRVPEGAESIYHAQDGRNSPLSQPIAGAPLVVKATVDRMQQVKPGSVRVFFTYETNTNENISAATSLYGYTDVLGTEMMSSEVAPIYAWNPTVDEGLGENSDPTKLQAAMAELQKWSLASWFKGIEDYVATQLTAADADTRAANFNALSVIANAKENTNLNTSTVETVALTPLASYTEADTLLTFKTDDDNIVSIVQELKANDMVRYSVWAIFETEDSTAENPRYGYAILDEASYTEHPWYFPRNFNTEMRNRYDTIAGYAKVEPSTSQLFSPYFWVYDMVPGEVFINEFNFEDREARSGLAAFVEICTPTAMSLKGWRFDYALGARNSTDSAVEMSTSPAEFDDTVDPSQLLSPDAGVVPVQRTIGTQANRTFYTLVQRGIGDSNFGLEAYDANDTATDVTLLSSRNAGRAQTGADSLIATRNEAVAVRLYRPTGGMEHLVLFSRFKSETASSSALTRAIGYLNDLTTSYRTFYKQAKFGSEWFQAFREGGWETYKFDASTIVDKDADGNVQVTEAHRARRLAVASYYNGSQNGNYDRENAAGDSSFDPSFITDCYASTQTTNSIATVDMGGVWVMRTNNADEDEGLAGTRHGATDATDLFADNWPGYNPTEKTRSGATITPPAAQITPRQINLDQYMLYYADPNGNTVNSKVVGLGQHMAELRNADGDVLNTIHGGRTQLHRSIANASTVKMTYTPLAFNRLTSLTLTVTNTKDGIVLHGDEGKTIIDILLKEMDGKYVVDTTDEKVATITFAVNDTAEAYEVIFSTANDSLLYSFDFEATFEADATLAKAVIQKVRPFCGDTLKGSAKHQPWKGSSFGFSVVYSPDELAKTDARLVGAVVTYPTPDPEVVDEIDSATATWTGLKAFSMTDNSETVHIPALTGLTEDAAWATLNTLAEKGKLRTASLGSSRKISETESEIYGASAVPVLAQTYALTVKEPAIPYFVWGVYAQTIQVGAETETITFFMPQADDPAVSPMPEWYRPLERLTVSLPYFYLYSTPPESVWLNELNLVKGEGEDDPFAEVVFPVLREGITKASVDQPTIEGWSVRNSDGVEAMFDRTATGTPAGASSSYNFYTINLAGRTSTDPIVGYALIRPCGAGEGGVWTGVTSSDATTDVPVATDVDMGKWMWMMPGQTDLENGTGSIQLVGETTTRDGYKFISSYADERTTWRYNANATPNDNNAGVNVDDNPEWNRVRVTSTLLNTVYGGSPCGYHDFDNLPETSLPIGFGEGESFAGGDWVSTIANNKLGRYITYRPRAGYTYDYLQIPPEWMGRVILVGQRIAKKLDAFPEANMIELAKQAITYSNAFANPMDKAAALVSLNGFATAERSAGAFTGKIVFDGEKEVAEGLLFKDTDDYVIAILLTEEPIAATNELTMGLCPGTVEAGAWLVSQSFYGLKLDKDVWIPDEDKGGAVGFNPRWEGAEKANYNPIWDDESGNGEGEYQHRHGWLYQPIVGDTLSMSAVIRPDNGLYSDDIDVVAAMTSEKPTIRPMLVWTVIDETKVPDNLFSSNDATVDGFLGAWDLSYMIGGTPSFRDGISTSFTTVRQNIEATNNAGMTSSTLYVAGGILPMSFRGIRKADDGKASTNDFEPKASLTDAEVMALNESDTPYLAFSVMSASELGEAIKTGGSLETIANLPTNDPNDDMVDLTTEISMVNGESSNYWKEGSILRFAVVLVDVTTGRILDAQGVSNFKSDELPIYCPWYVPEETADINYVSKSKKAGYSPYAWVYDIGFDDVWINEIRPFMSPVSAQPSGGTAVELAMKASANPIQPNDDNKYIPEKSLDGWKLVVKYAPIPLLETINEDTKLDWTRSTDVAAQSSTHPLYGRTIPLKSWIPAPRLFVEPENAPADYWSLDYYCVATSASAISEISKEKLQVVEDYATCVAKNDPYGFAYLKTATEVTTGEAPKNDFGDHLVSKTDIATQTTTHTLTRNILPDYESLVEALPAGYCNNGLVFGIELVRNNGVVSDEILFMYTSDSASVASLKERLDAVVTIEENSFASANKIRAIYSSTAIAGNGSFMFVDEVVDSDDEDLTTDTIKDTLWAPGITATGGVVNTFPGANNFTTAGLGADGNSYPAYYKQPRLSYTYTINKALTLAATVKGGRMGITKVMNAALSPKVEFKQWLSGQYVDIGTEGASAVCSNVSKGLIYTLRVSPVADQWFDCTVLRNNAEDSTIKPTSDGKVTVNSEDGKEAVTLPTYLIVDKAVLTESTSYTITLLSNIAMNKLLEAAEFDNPAMRNKAENSNFELWLLGSNPEDVIKRLNDPLTLAEKFWVGLENALDKGEDVKLAFKQMSTLLSEDGTTAYPMVAISFENGEEAICTLKSDGALVLLGKESLSDEEWVYVQRLNPASDINNDEAGNLRVQTLNTKKKIFKVRLVSEAEAMELQNKAH